MCGNSGAARWSIIVALLSGMGLAAACGGSSSAKDAGANTGAAGGDAGSQADARSGGTGAAGKASGGTEAPPPRDAGAAGSGTAGASGAAGGSGSGRAGNPSAMDAAASMPNDAGTPADAAADASPGAMDAGPAPTCGRCDAYAAPMKSGAVEVSELNALSGLASSRSQPEIVFAHNDHDRAVVYALDFQGRLHARITLEGAMASDIEDIAVGPCGDRTCVFLGDVGDNAATRKEYAVLRFVEPKVPSEPGSTAMTATFERYRFTYEDGSHNAESLMVGPDGSVYVVTKLAPGSGGNVAANGVSSVYKLAASALATSTAARASKVATLTVPMTGDKAASAAAAHPCGQGFLVRTYNRVYEFVTPAGGNFEAAFGVTPSVVAMPDEPQSEGIDYRSDGRGFLTSGEGAKAPLLLTSCKP